MSEIFQTIRYRGSKINIRQDETPQNPRKDWDPMGNMICWHRDYRLGDEHTHDDTEAMLADIAGIDVDSEPYYSMDIAEFRRRLKEEANKVAVILPLYLYDHSGITMSTGPFSCPWDSGCVGWIYATLDDVRAMGHNWQRWSDKRRKQVAKWLEGEVETYDHYLTGEVYGFEIDDYEDSCWGFFGDPDESGCISEAMAVVDHERNAEKVKVFKQLKAWIRNNVPLNYRKPKYIIA